MDAKDRVPFFVPAIGDEEIEEVVRSLRSGWLTTGPQTKEFEQRFAELIGGGVQALAVNSATSGLHLALEACGVSAGDEVITTPYTFTATAEVIRYLGADPVFVDVKADTLNLDPEQIEAAITDSTKAIMPVHFAGYPCEMNEILEIASRYELRVIEDAAHALPSVYEGALIGSLRSDATVFSFYATKPITTGEGGMICSKDPEILDRCRTMRLHGISRDAFDRYTADKPSWSYEVVAPGFKYNLTDIASSIGIHQLKKVEKFRDQRKELAYKYTELLDPFPVKTPAHCVGHAWHLYVIRLMNSDVSRDEVIAELADQGISCSVHFMPLHLQPYWRDRYNFQDLDFPNAYDAYQRAISLPLFPGMTNQQINRVVNCLGDSLDQC
ncbi:MAG: DegT/DnrJ/EryC1/StrS family aminotransferase [Pseudomonadales bacterium]|nr:DegT/DnrJ/EryC1/StrS family aminotransferase [Pseudomonadales bacterium]MBO7004785.1 DegT/DnrJ/EryC1/StrS family aminotransferase [Pseudomonadales bacterium]